MSEAKAAKPRTGRQRADARLSDDAAREDHRRVKSLFIGEEMRQRANRYQMALDESYRDGEQFTPTEMAEIIERGGAPVVINECKPVADFLLGTVIRARVDGEVIQRFDDSDAAAEDARVKTQILKLVDDLNNVQFARTDAADDCLVAGMGWMEVGVTADTAQHPIIKRAVSWRNMLHDSMSGSAQPEDWSYVFRFREVDLDVAVEMFPANCADKLRRAATAATTRSRSDMDTLLSMGSEAMDFGPFGGGMTGDKWGTYDADAWLRNPRERVALIEAWEARPRRLQMPDGSDAPSMMAKRCSIMTMDDMLLQSWSPYSHGRFPFVPLWCYRRKLDGAPYGVIRQLRGAQDLLNKQMAKAMFRTSSRQVLLEDGALDPALMTEAELEAKVNDPSAVMHFARGALVGGKVQIKDGTGLAQADIALAEQYKQSIRQSSGVASEDRGLDPHQVSGKAREIRQQQGSVLTAPIFDNLLRARQLEMDLTLALVEQYHTEPMTFRAPGKLQSVEWIKVNQPDPNNPGQRINDITQLRAQYVVGEAPWHQSMAEAAFESAMDMLTQMASVAPQVVLSVLDIVFEMHPTLPKKHQIVARIRQVTGQQDPDAPQDPAAQAAKAKQAQVAQAQMDAQLAQLKADVVEAEARGQKLTAESVAKRLESLYMAARAAQVLTAAPNIAPVADELVMSAGFKDEHGDAALGAPVPLQQSTPMPDAMQADGALAGHEAGIRSPDVTGIQPQEIQ